MVELEFVFAGTDASLGDLADAVLADIEAKGGEWYTRYGLTRTGDGYRGIRLTALSAALGEGDWSLEALLTEFATSPCGIIPTDQVGHSALRSVRQPLIVAESDGMPTALYQGQSSRRMARTDRRGWWRLVGKRMAELEQVPEWPDPLPEQFQYDEIQVVDAKMTLRDLAARLQDCGEDAVLAIPGDQSRWAVCPAKDLLQRLAREFADAAPGSMVGAFVDPGTIEMAALERAETPWELIKEMLSRDRSTMVRYLVTEAGQPSGILTRHQVMRGRAKGGPSSGQAAGWARFLQTAPEIEPAAQDQGRVVNAWFADRQRKLVPHTQALAANRIYHLGVNIGTPSDRSHVVGEQPSLPPRLVSYLVGLGRPLVLRLDSEDWTILQGELEVMLPRSGSTPDVHFLVATPVRTGLSRLRLGVYFDNNLVQSYLVYAQVAPEEGQMAGGADDGWWSECEYTLSSDLTNLEDLGARRVCIWIGKGMDGTHRAGISASTGLDMGPALDVNASLVGSALARYRELLGKACFDDPDADKPQYRYGNDHAPLDDTAFEKSLVNLAELGQVLYERVFGTQSGQRVAKHLRDIEGAQVGPLVVQIARLSLDATFPWAVLYDRPLRYDPRRNTICSRFLQEGQCGADCPHAEDPYVVCPSGFWGFRYIIEQPLRPPNAYASVATRLSPGRDPRLALVYGTGLGMAETHRDRVDKVLGSRAASIVHDNTNDLLQEMHSEPAVIYFYCHGGNTPNRQWLVVGDQDPLMPAYLDDSLRADWVQQAPLVVLNGCHTGKYDPSTLLSFVHRFGALGAAGVVGTEIPIHEILGDAFGQFLLDRLLEGDPVGKIVYDFRHDLLTKKNPLGLVYVPYCYADLCLEKREAQNA
jgi:CHAT domain-containing protein